MTTSHETHLEAPALRLRSAAVCLHFVEPAGDAGWSADYPNCPVMRSMELDLLSYRFQDHPPFGSQCETHGIVPGAVLFPDQVHYQSEGRSVTLSCPNPRRPVNLILTSTRFLRSGIRIWHLTITPAAGEHFSELDLIKLVHLYDGRTEATTLAADTRFELGGVEVPLAAVLRNVHPPARCVLPPRAGTLQIVEPGEVVPGRTLSDLLSEARPVDASAVDASELGRWVDEETPEARALMAVCGIVSGIFDFNHLDADEIRDILEPTVPEGDGMIRVHRCTLTAFSDEDRAMTECADSIGVSPYLLIPHAALLHNEAVVDQAERVMDAALSARKARLRDLQAAHAEADDCLNGLFLPNVFNYRSERLLFARGAEERGSEDRRTAAVARLGQLDARISNAWDERRDGGQMCIAVLLAVISVFQLQGTVFELLGEAQASQVRWSALIGLAAFTAVGIVLFWRRGMRR